MMQSILAMTSHIPSAAAGESLFPEGYQVAVSSMVHSGLERLQGKRYDLVFIDLDLLSDGTSSNNYQKAMQPFWAIYPLTQIIVITPKDKIQEAVRAVKAGAFHYVTLPLDPFEIKQAIEDIQEYAILKSELDYLRDVFWKKDVLESLKTNTDSMKAIYHKIRSVAPTRTTVILYGETGTGKNVLAKIIHKHSNREADQFISVHCGAIPDTLLESELFGHEKGSFTGAIRRKLGKFEIAKGGTIFLDEIGTISPSAQIKLLQVLQDGTFNRVGGDQMIETDARVVAATNADLKALVDQGLFRKDLYYRFNVFPLEVPPLRERIDDIPIFVEIFLKRLNRDLQKNIHGIHPHVLEAFRKYAWPGNIRELENLIERACILENSSILSPASFPNEIFQTMTPSPEVTAHGVLPILDARRIAIEDFERHYIKNLLGRNKGKIFTSAGEAGISTRQLNKLMLKYRIRKEDYKL
ncbi:MAG: sigma-54 dependent transcriptional regulator [Desulfobacteraceae bacterium]|nr:sigma-54 dependent transcriptional regulator [Desulfobacteraceae bacterium]